MPDIPLIVLNYSSFILPEAVMCVCVFCVFQFNSPIIMSFCIFMHDRCVRQRCVVERGMGFTQLLHYGRRNKKCQFRYPFFYNLGGIISHDIYISA